ncbi:MAG: hypothetical protein EXR95_02370 [Gemmatimonadetes bacterium]|nr:hypothetical protein [Gemmatimonadota bacterium]
MIKIRAIRAALCLGALELLAACSGGTVPTVTELEVGSWGGDNAGMIVDDSVAHVHIGCTYGNFPLPGAIDADGRFTASGSYLLRAYPIAVGPTMPAVLKGDLERDALTFTVTVTDTIAKTTVVLGPARVTLGREPKLGPCPICAVAPVMR